jgi:hypothetical protein
VLPFVFCNLGFVKEGIKTGKNMQKKTKTKTQNIFNQIQIKNLKMQAPKKSS